MGLHVKVSQFTNQGKIITRRAKENAGSLAEIARKRGFFRLPNIQTFWKEAGLSVKINRSRRLMAFFRPLIAQPRYNCSISQPHSCSISARRTANWPYKNRYGKKSTDC
jgi:hypothetical protein